MTQPFPIVDAIELALSLAGLALLCRFVVERAGGRGGSQLARWEIAPVDFALLVWGVFVAGYLAMLVAGGGAALFRLGSDLRMIVGGAALPLGLIAGCAAFHRNRWPRDTRLELPRAGFMNAGAAVFLIAFPLVGSVAFAWQYLLERAGLTAELQEVVEVYLRLDTVGAQLAMAVVAVMLAPVAEELVFRGVVFRYARGRLPRWGALLLPAAVWASLHGLTAFAPLLLFGIVLELAYERTGNLAVPMAAHALFNLHTVLILLLDPPK